MKRGLILILIFLISLYNAYAQGIRIGGQDISLIVIIPLILIIIVGIIFAVMFIIDTRNYNIRKGVVNIPELGRTKVIEEVEIKTTAKEEEKALEEIKPRIWINYLDVIDSFVKRAEEREIKEALNIIIRIIKEFFKDRFNLNYEFTYDELLDELKKKNFTKTELIKYLRDLTYKDEKADKKIIFYLCDQLRDIVRLIDKDKLEKIESENVNENLKFNKTRRVIAKVQKRENIIDQKLNNFLREEAHKLFRRKNEPKKIEIKKVYDDFDREKLEQISLLIRNGREALENNNIIKLREIYSDICYLFPFLSDKSKKTAYLEILEFYEDINKNLFPEFYKEIKK